MFKHNYTRLGLGGRGPLCGIGVASLIERIWMPLPEKARRTDSRPAPTPRIITDASFSPIIMLFSPRNSPTLAAAYGVDFLAPEKPSAPALEDTMAFPLSSVIIAFVLLKVASI